MSDELDKLTMTTYKLGILRGLGYPLDADHEQIARDHCAEDLGIEDGERKEVSA